VGGYEPPAGSTSDGNLFALFIMLPCLSLLALATGGRRQIEDNKIKHVFQYIFQFYENFNF